jgi:hypothetical protein
MSWYEFFITPKTQSFRPPLIQLLIPNGPCRSVRCFNRIVIRGWSLLVVWNRFCNVVIVEESGFSGVLGKERLLWVDISNL